MNGGQTRADAYCGNSAGRWQLERSAIEGERAEAGAGAGAGAGASRKGAGAGVGLGSGVVEVTDNERSSWEGGKGGRAALTPAPAPMKVTPGARARSILLTTSQGATYLKRRARVQSSLDEVAGNMCRAGPTRSERPLRTMYEDARVEASGGVCRRWRGGGGGQSQSPTPRVGGLVVQVGAVPAVIVLAGYAAAAAAVVVGSARRLPCGPRARGGGGGVGVGCRGQDERRVGAGGGVGGGEGGRRVGGGARASAVQLVAAAGVVTAVAAAVGGV